jgi:uncharacterized protein (DUF488 family)
MAVHVTGEALDMVLFTIGHSNHSLDKFLGLLEGHDVVTLVDVRSAPYSRFNPQFNRKSLEGALPQHGIGYVYVGQQLGGRPSDPTCYKSQALPGKAADYPSELDYPEVMKRPWFVEGVQRLLELANKQTTVIMCSEEDPAKCHRHHLIAQYLMNEHPEVDVRHIRGDGAAHSARLLMASTNAPTV